MKMFRCLNIATLSYAIYEAQAKGPQGPGLSVGENANTRDPTNTAVGVDSTSAGKHSTALGKRASANYAHSTSLGQDTVGYYGSTQLGDESYGYVGSTTSLGYQAGGGGLDSTALGAKSHTQFRDVALGYGATSQSGGTAVGDTAFAFSKKSSAFGFDAQAADRSVAVGSHAQAKERGSTAIGYHSTAYFQDSIALGHESLANGNSSAALGHDAVANALESHAIGAQSAALAEGTTALAYKANAMGLKSMAIGVEAVTSAQADNSIAVGNQASSLTSRSVSIGQKATNLANPSENAFVPADNVAVGLSATTQGTMNTAVGANSNANFIGDTALGAITNAEGVASTALGFDASASESGLAIGTRSQASGFSAAIGPSALANQASLAMGYLAQAESESVAMGLLSMALGQNEVAVGGSATAADNYTIAIGHDSVAYSRGAVAIGAKASAGGDNSIALGYHVGTSINNAAVIGTDGFQQDSNGFFVHRLNVGIDTSTPNPKADLTLGSPDHGLQLNQVSDPTTSVPRCSLEDVGLLIYNKLTSMLNFWTGNFWSSTNMLTISAIVYVSYQPPVRRTTETAQHGVRGHNGSRNQTQNRKLKSAKKTSVVQVTYGDPLADFGSAVIVDGFLSEMGVALKHRVVSGSIEFYPIVNGVEITTLPRLVLKAGQIRARLIFKSMVTVDAASIVTIGAEPKSDAFGLFAPLENVASLILLVQQ